MSIQKKAIEFSNEEILDTSRFSTKDLIDFSMIINMVMILMTMVTEI